MMSQRLSRVMRFCLSCGTALKDAWVYCQPACREPLWLGMRPTLGAISVERLRIVGLGLLWRNKLEEFTSKRVVLYTIYYLRCLVYYSQLKRIFYDDLITHGLG